MPYSIPSSSASSVSDYSDIENDLANLSTLSATKLGKRRRSFHTDKKATLKRNLRLNKRRSFFNFFFKCNNCEEYKKIVSEQDVENEKLKKELDLLDENIKDVKDQLASAEQVNTVLKEKIGLLHQMNDNLKFEKENEKTKVNEKINEQESLNDTLILANEKLREDIKKQALKIECLEKCKITLQESVNEYYNKILKLNVIYKNNQTEANKKEGEGKSANATGNAEGTETELNIDPKEYIEQLTNETLEQRKTIQSHQLLISELEESEKVKKAMLESEESKNKIYVDQLNSTITKQKEKIEDLEKTIERQTGVVQELEKSLKMANSTIEKNKNISNSVSGFSRSKRRRTIGGIGATSMLDMSNEASYLKLVVKAQEEQIRILTEQHEKDKIKIAEYQSQRKEHLRLINSLLEKTKV
ncbi:hypothetical protein BCR32DRAFT_326325 [Anaeromyces robustus]|uniref:Uncharacterized protein n=1 Tax=Anaeromyces robustus TaxID=1754192 RepID=A0A1Y1XD32_9FUNG|nr:hypothetical protein BCR32DRAFT_326325 [Anaeromyces robustus]|eukprot:ORX83592.1 hypothetical protein BCR32DRAFT_326325 [Anaeromyces robustus]